MQLRTSRRQGAGAIQIADTKEGKKGETTQANIVSKAAAAAAAEASAAIAAATAAAAAAAATAAAA